MWRTKSHEKKIIDTGAFEIEVPADWKYKKERGIDSFVGRIKGEGVDLSFDYSEMGYANSLIPDEKEFVYEQTWEWPPPGMPYGKEGVTYVSGDVEAERKRIMEEKGINDSSLVKVEKIQIPEIAIFFKENKYSATLTYEDTVVNVKIDIPEEIKQHQIQIDTLGHYKRKLVRPVSGKKGMTGIYLKDLNSSFNFSLMGEDLSTENQEKVIEAFKTIKIKRE